MYDDVRFRKKVEDCSSALEKPLKKLALRYSPYVVMAALSEHVAGALHLMQREGVCTAAEARAVLRRLERIAFDGCGGPPSSSPPPSRPAA